MGVEPTIQLREAVFKTAEVAYPFAVPYRAFLFCTGIKTRNAPVISLELCTITSLIAESIGFEPMHPFGRPPFSKGEQYQTLPTFRIAELHRIMTPFCYHTNTNFCLVSICMF